MLVHLVLHQRLPLPAGAPSFTPQKSFACWSATAQPPSFFGTRTFLPHVARVSVLSTHPVLTRPPPSWPYGVMAFVVSTPPASLGPHPPANLACLVPLTTAYTPTPLACCGVSVTLRTPYRECDRGYRHEPLTTIGIRVSADSSFYVCNNCAKLGKLATPQFL